jgi:hypothetical protein
MLSFWQVLDCFYHSSNLKPCETLSYSVQVAKVKFKKNPGDSLDSLGFPVVYRKLSAGVSECEGKGISIILVQLRETDELQASGANRAARSRYEQKRGGGRSHLLSMRHYRHAPGWCRRCRAKSSSRLLRSYSWRSRHVPPGMLAGIPEGMDQEAQYRRKIWREESAC